MATKFAREELTASCNGFGLSVFVAPFLVLFQSVDTSFTTGSISLPLSTLKGKNQVKSFDYSKDVRTVKTFVRFRFEPVNALLSSIYIFDTQYVNK